MNTKIYQYRKDNNLCVSCGCPTNNSYVMCDDCREKDNQRRKANIAYYLKIHICPVCRKNTIMGQEKTCVECKAKSAEKKGE